MFLENSFRDAISLLSTRNRKKYYAAIILQCSLGFLDVVGVLLTGVIAALASSVISGTKIPGIVSSFISLRPLKDRPYSDIMLTFAIIAMSIFLIKSILALTFTKRMFGFLAAQQGSVASKSLKAILDSPYIWVKRQDPHYLTNTLLNGIAAATVNALAQLILISAELFLLVLFLFMLFIANPVLAISTLLYLGISFLFMNKIIGKKVAELNRKRTEVTLQNQEHIFNVMKLFREIKVSGKEESFSKNANKMFTLQANYFAYDTWIQQIPKYAVEFIGIFGAAILLISQKFSGGTQVVTILAIYLAGASRILPSALRVQSSILSLRVYSALSASAHELIRELRYTAVPKIGINTDRPKSNRKDIAELKLSGVNYKYPDSEFKILDDLSLSFFPGEHIAIVGPSGSGKSTLCDLLLGLIEPDTGSVIMDNEAISNWRTKNSVAYLPQEIVILNGTIEENIALGEDATEVDFIKLVQVMESTNLHGVLKDYPLHSQKILGVNGTNLSGGQRQRIGIARILYRDPKLIILDESTSSLDAETESIVMNSIRNISQETIVVAIAHRLSSIKNFSRVIYLDGGKVLADGDFEHVRNVVPEFERQIEMMTIPKLT